MTPTKPDLRQVAINALSFLVTSIADLIFHVIRIGIRLTTGKSADEVPLKLEKNKKMVGAIALTLVIAASLSSLLLTTCEFQPSLPKANLLPYQGTGQVLAEETAKLLGNKGKIVVLVMDTGQVEITADDPRMNAFTEAIKGQKDITVMAVEKISPSLMIRSPAGKMLRAEPFLEIFQQYPNVDAIVSLIGVPRLADEQIGGLAQNRPKFVAVSDPATSSSELKKLFEAQVLQLAIAPRGHPSTNGGKPPSTPREWFDQNYIVVTPESAPTHDQ